jgi:dTDP-4-amino-4,6-dideoxygalactose transaminase
MIVPLGHVEVTPRQIELVTEALRNNRISRGPFTDKFESLIGEIHGVSHSVFMASGTCALLVALEAAKELQGWPDGAEVIVPATTFIATVAAVRQAGLTPVLCDVRADDANIDVSKIGGSITPRTVAILPVHLLGRACDMTNLMMLADDFGLEVIEDCCEAIGVSHCGRPVGSWGLAGVISTYVCHHVSTGVGGSILTNSDALATICRSLMVHGRNPVYLRLEDDDDLDDSSMKIMMNARYNFCRWGHSFRASEMEAALGVGEMEECPVDESRKKRNAIAGALSLIFQKWPDRIALQEWPHGSSPLFAPIMCDTPETCRGLSRHFEKNQIETRPVMSLCQPIIVKMLAEQDKSFDDFPIACQWRDRGFLVGCHPAISMDQIRHIESVTAAYFSGESS